MHQKSECCLFISTDLHEVTVMLAVSLQAEPAEQIFLPSLHQLIEDVEVSLAVVLVDHTGLLQQVTQDMTTDCTTLREKGHPQRLVNAENELWNHCMKCNEDISGHLVVKLDVHVFPKAAWVVILQGFGISESLEDI